MEGKITPLFRKTFVISGAGVVAIAAIFFWEPDKGMK
jgi:hypothetical protein